MTAVFLLALRGHVLQNAPLTMESKCTDNADDNLFLDHPPRQFPPHHIPPHQFPPWVSYSVNSGTRGRSAAVACGATEQTLSLIVRD